MKHRSGISRRQVLQAGAAIAGATALGATGKPAAAEPSKEVIMDETRSATLNLTPHPEGQAWTRFRLGDATVTVVSDGTILAGPPDAWFYGLAPGEMEDTLRAQFLSETEVSVGENILVVDLGSRRVMFDTGTGGAPQIGPTAGHLRTNLAAAGIDPGSVTDIVLSHGHPDHVLGLADGEGRPVYGNAQVHVSELDHRMMLADPNPNDPFATEVKRQITAVADRIALLRDGQDVLPGVTAIAAPGHTSGHMIFAITSGPRTLINAADLGHHHAIFTRHPQVKCRFDADAEMMVATRKRLFDMIATDRLAFLGYHFPFPGVGHLARFGSGYTYVPASMDTV